MKLKKVLQLSISHKRKKFQKKIMNMLKLTSKAKEKINSEVIRACFRIRKTFKVW